MGYTHYSEQSRPFTKAEWAKVTREAKRIVKCAKADGVTLVDGMGDAGTKPEIGADIIVFNGEGSDSYETLVLEREGNGFNFCKTAERPYDKAVVSILAAARDAAPDAIEISSDGGPEAFEDVY